MKEKIKIYVMALAVIITCYLLVVCSAVLQAQPIPQHVVRKGNQFEVDTTKSVIATMTQFTYKDKDGIVYPIYLSNNNKAFIIRKSKNTSKYYKYYLSKEISEQITKEIKK